MNYHSVVIIVVSLFLALSLSALTFVPRLFLARDITGETKDVTHDAQNGQVGSVV